MTRHWLAGIMMITVGLAACGGDDGGEGSPIAIDGLGAELATATCAHLFECCTEAELMEAAVGDGTEASCVSSLTQLLDGFLLTPLRASVTAGRIIYHDDVAGDCLATISGLACGAEPPTLCEGIFEPTVADAGACASDGECVSGYCEGATEGADGMCTALPGIGDPCTSTCVDGAYCSSTKAGQVCAAKLANGETCFSADECTSDNCDDATGTCTTPAPTCDGV